MTENVIDLGARRVAAQEEQREQAKTEAAVLAYGRLRYASDAQTEQLRRDPMPAINALCQENASLRLAVEAAYHLLSGSGEMMKEVGAFDPSRPAPDMRQTFFRRNDEARAVLWDEMQTWR